MTMKKERRPQEVAHNDYDRHIDKTLSMVIHFEEIEQMAAVIKRIHRNRAASSSVIGTVVDE